MDGVAWLYRLPTKHAAQRVLSGRLRARDAPQAGRFTRADVSGLLDAAWAQYRVHVRDIPGQPTAGSAMNVRLACLTLSFFEVLLAAGVERGYAVELVADAAWQIYRKWALIAFQLTRARPRARAALRFAVLDKRGDVSLRFPFNAPGYQIETVANDRGVAFDVVKCPVAAYLYAKGAADLCLASWCNLDYALADLSRETLVRTKTLAAGEDRCDFRVVAR